MSYEKLGFTSGQTLKAEHLNHMEDGIANAGGGANDRVRVMFDADSWTSDKTYEEIMQELNGRGAEYLDIITKGYRAVRPLLVGISEEEGIYMVLPTNVMTSFFNLISFRLSLGNEWNFTGDNYIFRGEEAMGAE